MPAPRNPSDTTARALANQGIGTRPHGRPRREIDLVAVTDVAAKLFNEDGYDAVSIEAVAEELSVSRATLYRTVRSKEELLGLVFERSTAEVYQLALDALRSSEHPREVLFALIRMQVAAAIRLRDYMSVFFGGAGLPADTFDRWRIWAREYEAIWSEVVGRAMQAGALEPDDPKVTTRLILGMIMWICRWYHPSHNLTADEIAEAAIKLVQRDSGPHSVASDGWAPMPPLFSDRS